MTNKQKSMRRKNPRYISHGVAGQQKPRKRRNVVPEMFGAAFKSFMPGGVGMMNPRKKRVKRLRRVKSPRVRTIATPTYQFNPKGLTKIYGRVLRVEAQKTGIHRCDAACKKAQHRYFHNFSTKPALYGTPDRKMLIIK